MATANEFRGRDAEYWANAYQQARTAYMRVLKGHEDAKAENADLREELAALRNGRRAIDPVEMMALDMRSGSDLVITVHDENHLDGVRQAANQYANVLQSRGLDCNIIIAPPGVELTTRAKPDYGPRNVRITPEELAAIEYDYSFMGLGADGRSQWKREFAKDYNLANATAANDAPGYCPACGGSGGHRIGCPSK